MWVSTSLLLLASTSWTLTGASFPSMSPPLLTSSQESRRREPSRRPHTPPWSDSPCHHRQAHHREHNRCSPARGAEEENCPRQHDARQAELQQGRAYAAPHGRAPGPLLLRLKGRFLIYSPSLSSSSSSYILPLATVLYRHYLVRPLHILTTLCSLTYTPVPAL